MTSLDQGIGLKILEVDAVAVKRAKESGAQFHWRGLTKDPNMLEDYEEYESSGKVSLMPLWSRGMEFGDVGHIIT